MTEKKIPPRIEAELQESGVHGHIHEHIHTHIHQQIHEHLHEQILEGENVEHEHATQHGRNPENIACATTLTIRSHSGISGDILLAGVAALLMELNGITPASPVGDAWLADLTAKIMPEFSGAVKIRQRMVNGIAGFGAEVHLPTGHTHRNIGDIASIIDNSALAPKARDKAMACFRLLAECEGHAHNISAEEVHFHEVGALDSILDICTVCELLDMLHPDHLICSPLPVADGSISCAHGILPAPAPAVLRLLKGVPVKAFAGSIDAGEVVTPTGIALLLANNAVFGAWPRFNPAAIATIYGQKIFANAPNGIIFAFGASCKVNV